LSGGIWRKKTKTIKFDRGTIYQKTANGFYYFRYQGITFAELPDVAARDLPYPLVLKPAVGFFSLGVHVVRDPEEWRRAVHAVRRDVDAISRQYPRQVLNTERFIIEQCIQGREFAVDVFFNARGEAVIINIIEHLFASAKDVSDRVYIASSAIIDPTTPGKGPATPASAQVGTRPGAGRCGKTQV